jgi:hypothetical protein
MRVLGEPRWDRRRVSRTASWPGRVQQTTCRGVSAPGKRRLVAQLEAVCFVRVGLGQDPLQSDAGIEDFHQSSSRASRSSSTAMFLTPYRSSIARRAASPRSVMRLRNSGSVTRVPNHTSRATSSRSACSCVAGECPTTAIMTSIGVLSREDFICQHIMETVERPFRILVAVNRVPRVSGCP